MSDEHTSAQSTPIMAKTHVRDVERWWMAAGEGFGVVGGDANGLGMLAVVYA